MNIAERLMNAGKYRTETIKVPYFGEEMEFLVREPMLSTWYKYIQVVTKEDVKREEVIDAELRLLSQCVFLPDGSEIFTEEAMAEFRENYGNSFSLLIDDVVKTLDLDKLGFKKKT